LRVCCSFQYGETLRFERARRIELKVEARDQHMYSNNDIRDAALLCQRGESIVEIASVRMSALLKDTEDGRINGLNTALRMANEHWERAREGFAKIIYSNEVLGKAFSKEQVELKDDLVSDYNKLIDCLEKIAEKQKDLHEGRFSLVLGGSLLCSDLATALLNIGHDKTNAYWVYTIALSIGFIVGGVHKIKKGKKEGILSEKR
jgi:hypothetical protein